MNSTLAKLANFPGFWMQQFFTCNHFHKLLHPANFERLGLPYFRRCHTVSVPSCQSSQIKSIKFNECRERILFIWFSIKNQFKKQPLCDIDYNKSWLKLNTKELLFALALWLFQLTLLRLPLLLLFWRRYAPNAISTKTTTNEMTTNTILMVPDCLTTKWERTS